MINFYNQLGKEADKYNNPNGNKYGIYHPFRILIIGPSGSGKTNALLNLTSKLNCFEKYYVFVKLAGDDPLYDNVLIPKIQEAEQTLNCEILMEYSDDLDDLPDIKSDAIDSSCQNIFIFDDFLDKSSKNLKKIEAYFTKARKKNCSLVFISQDFFSVPPIIRRNCTQYIFTKINSENDLRNIYRDLAKNDFATFENFKKFFSSATAGNNILTIYKNGKYRKNFCESISPP